MRNIFAFLFLFFAHFVFSQRVSRFQLLFDSDKSEITQNTRRKLDSVIGSLANIPQAYTISIAGHTDNEGDLAYNKALSLKRASVIKEHFVNKGFSTSKIKSLAFAYTKPVAKDATEGAHAKNRRVEVEIFAPALPDKLLSSTNTLKTYTLLAEQGGVFKYPSGTEIKIPANAFVNEEDSPVHGLVSVTYKEYRTQLDFIAGNIPMSFMNTQNEFVQFNSGGMFKIDCYQKNKALKLKPGSDLKINFVKTQTLPEMQFFSFDTSHVVWHADGSMLNTLANTRIRKAPEFYLKRDETTKIVRNLYKHDSCLLAPCTGTFLAIRKGIELASSEHPVNLDKPDLYFGTTKKPTLLFQSYRVKISSSTANNVRFKIIPQGETSVYLPFKDYEWDYNSQKKHPFKTEWENVLWLRIKVDYLTENDFYLTFFSNDRNFKLAVKACVTPKGKTDEEMYTTHSRNLDANIATIARNAEEMEDYSRQEDKNLYKYSGLNADRMLRASRDSLFCMYSYSREWMSDQEAGMSFEAWFDYFNAHKTLMKERYLKLNSNENFLSKECISRERERIAAEIRSYRKAYQRDSLIFARNEEQQSAVNALMEELSIKSLGIFNCDQVQRLNDPVYVRKTYKDIKGKKIDPIIIYIIDRKVSGALTYNGYMNLSPYYFPLSRASENTMVAYDLQNNAYLCRPEKLSAYIRENNFGDIILEPLYQNSQEEIAKALK